MWKVLTFLALLCFLFSVEANIQPSIVGGNNATLGQFPYFVSIRYGSEFGI
jgi:secreted trypsin-like serine protease